MLNDDLKRLAKNLKTAREAANISQAAAALLVGKSRQTIVNWENGANTAEPSSGELAALAGSYGVSAMDLRFADLARRPAAPRNETAADALARLRAKEEPVGPVATGKPVAQPRKKKRGEK